MTKDSGARCVIGVVGLVCLFMGLGISLWTWIPELFGPWIVIGVIILVGLVIEESLDTRNPKRHCLKCMHPLVDGKCYNIQCEDGSQEEEKGADEE